VTATIRHVFGLPRSAEPAAVAGSNDGALQRVVGTLARGFPGTTGVYVEDLVSGHGAAWNARARFPAASTLKLAIAVEALRAFAGKPAPGSYLESLLRRMLIDSDNDAANQVESLFGGGDQVDTLLQGIKCAMDAIPALRVVFIGRGSRLQEVRRQVVPIAIHAYDLARLLAYVHLAAGGRGRCSASGPAFAVNAHLLYLSPTSPTAGSSAASSPATLSDAQRWISYARLTRDSSWPGNVFAPRC
jgi:hypothetical protein